MPTPGADESPSGPMPARTRTACVCSAVRRADRALNRLYDEALRPTGLATTQYALLSILAEEGRPLPHHTLAARQEMATTTLSRTLKPLARDGLVRIEPGEDRRTRYVAITPRGADVLARARPLWHAVQSQVVAELGEERAARLMRELAHLVGRLHGQ